MPVSTNVHHPFRGSVCLLLFAVTPVIAASACGGETIPDTLDRDTFVDAYVELRIAALLRSQPALEGAVKDSVLQDIGVTEEELLTFADVHGDDLAFMRDVWGDVSARLESIDYMPLDAPDPDSTGASPP